jgi:hypothetical protein
VSPGNVRTIRLEDLSNPHGLIKVLHSLDYMVCRSSVTNLQLVLKSIMFQAGAAGIYLDYLELPPVERPVLDRLRDMVGLDVR